MPLLSLSLSLHFCGLTCVAPPEVLQPQLLHSQGDAHSLVASLQSLVLQGTSPQVLSLSETHMPSRRPSWAELQAALLSLKVVVHGEYAAFPDHFSKASAVSFQTYLTKACPPAYPALQPSSQESGLSPSCLLNSSEALQGDLVSLLLNAKSEMVAPM